MNKRVTIPQAVEITGLTEYTLRQGFKRGWPHLRTGGPGKGKILVDIDLLEQYLAQEATGISAMPASSVSQYGQLRRVSESVAM